MPSCTCQTCGGQYHWNWEQAFDKFGFGDGDGQRETCTVVQVLETAGYVVESSEWGLHNEVIDSIKKDGVEQIPESATLGYDNPRGYLPAAIITLLDEKLPVAEGVSK
jgi:hypothetical protein